MKRPQIIERIIAEHQTVIESLRQSVNQYKNASDMDEESTHDPEDFSHQTEAKDMQLRFEKTLNEAEQSVAFLENETQKTHEVIEKGSLIETDTHYLFVGISLPAFKIGNKEVISFSEAAPVYAEMKAKTVGGKIIIGDRSLEINKIF